MQKKRRKEKVISCTNNKVHVRCNFMDQPVIPKKDLPIIDGGSLYRRGMLIPSLWVLSLAS